MVKSSNINQIPVFGVETSIPPTCGGLSYDHIEYYEESKLGVRIRYHGPSFIRADAYLYDLGIPNITDDFTSSEVMQCYQEACQNVFKAAEMGIYLDLESVNSQFLYLPQDAPDPFCLWAIFTFNQPPGPDVLFTGKQMSHIALRTDRGFINKVRYSYPFSEEMVEVKLNGFLTFWVEWTVAVQKFGCKE
jgi:hypothetical protein